MTNIVKALFYVSFAAVFVSSVKAAELPPDQAIVVERKGKQQARDKKTVWDFYKQHPRAQDFYPWGLYDIPRSAITDDLRDQEDIQNGIDVMAENGFNASWGHGTSGYFVNPPASKDDTLFVGPASGKPMPRNPVLNELGRQVYGELYPGREMKSLFCAQNWFRFNFPLVGESGPTAPGAYLSKEAFAKIEERAKGVLDFINDLGKNYPETIQGVSFDDEPVFDARAKAALALIEKHTGLYATTVHPSWGGFREWAPHMQPIGGDWYVTVNNFRKSWVIAERLRWLNKNHPEKVFLFTPLLTRYEVHDITLPGLKDALTSQTELRLQIWQAVALGCKGVYGWYYGGGVEFGRYRVNGFSPLNALLRPTNSLWKEMNDLSGDIVPVGPLLLSCQSETRYDLKLQCGTVHYPEFQGAALDYGLLRDVRPDHDRHFLIPWNNDIEHSQSGSLTVPPELLKQKKVYDLKDMKEVAMGSDGRMAVKLPPGGGRIYLITTPTEYAACCDTVLRHRVRHPRVVAGIEKDRASVIKGLDMTKANELLQQAKQAERANQWEKAAIRYRQAASAMRKAGKKVRLLAPVKSAIDKLADTLQETNELLYSHRDILGLKMHQGHWYRNKYAGNAVRNFITLIRSCRNGQRQLAKGNLHSPSFSVNSVRSLQQWAEENKQEVEGIVHRRLKETRSPVKVAFITPNQNQVEYNNLYTRLYYKTRIDWIAPDNKGNLVLKHTCADWINPGGKDTHSRKKGSAFSPDDYDVVYIHQLLYTNRPGREEHIAPEKVLMPEIVNATMRSQISSFVNKGGGLLLSGIAGLYANVLDVETKTPDHVRDNSFYPKVFAAGLVPAAGFVKHPAFKNIKPKGVFTVGNFPEQNSTTEVAFEKLKPGGRVIANEIDDVFGAKTDYAAVVEYQKGNGKIIVFGGKSIDFTPGVAHSLPAGNQPEDLLKRLVLFTVNTLKYLASDQSYQGETVTIRPGDEKPKKHFLPLAGWRFKTDPKDKGTKEGWHKPGFDTSSWKTIRIDSVWGLQGHENYIGPGWYRISINASKRPGKKTMLCFGGVDEEAEVYVNGKFAGEHKEGPKGWNKPFSIDITRFLSDTPQRHLLSVRAENTGAAGGIWRPVYLSYE